MKILLCHQYYKLRGGEDSVFEDELNYLISLGHEVRTFTIRHKDSKVAATFEYVAACLGYALATKDFKKAIVEFKPDCVRFHNVFPLLSTKAFKIAKQSNAKTSFVLHNFRPLCLNGLRLRKGKICNKCIDEKSFLTGIVYGCYRNSIIQSLFASLAWKLSFKRRDFDYIDTFVCLSNQSKEIYCKSGFPEEKIVVVRNRVNLQAPCVLSNIQERIDFLFVGRLSAEKGVKIFLSLSKLYKNYSFGVVGDGPEENDLINWIANEESKNLKYFGRLERKEITQLLKNSRALIITSIWDEHCPMVVLESLACGTPVISTNLGGQKELVTLVDERLVFDHENLHTFNPILKIILNESTALKEKSKLVALNLNSSWKVF